MSYPFRYSPLWMLTLLALAVATLCSCGKNDERSGEISNVTFTRDIAPIVFDKCACCHHPGKAAPFSLLTYEDCKRRASQIVEVTQKRFMPPWLPSDGHGDFVGARRLSDKELKTFELWAKAETPLGNRPDLPPTPEFADGWQTGRPDLVLESPAYTLSGKGSDEFRNFVVPIELDEPRWVESIELQPTNPRVTHHARLGVDGSYESLRRDAEDPEPGYPGMTWGQDPDGQLIVWAPGMVESPGAKGVAWRLHPKTCLVLHTHMQPSGKPEVVQFRIGVHFAAQPPDVHPLILRVGSRDVDIPADEPRHVIQDDYTLPVDVDLHMIFPHAHSLCREVNVNATLPDGSRQPLILIEHFDENWHETYRYRRPIRLPRGTKVSTVFSYDNTDKNLRNRHRPPQRTVYGSSVEDEMADVYLQVTAVHTDQRAALLEDYTQYDLKSQVVGMRKSLELHPNDPWDQEGAAAGYFGLGKPGEAIAMLEQRVKNGSQVTYPLASLGMALFASGDFAAAEAREREALALDSEFPLAWLGLAKALGAQKKSESAEQAYRKTLQLAPGLTDARLNLADLLIERGDLEEAAAECAAAISSAPDMANVRLKAAEVYARQRRYDEAMSELEEAIRLAPYTHPAKVLLAVYCFQNGDKPKARELLSEARAEMPEHPVPLLFLGQWARRDGKAENAKKYLTAAATKATPDNWPGSHRQRFLVLLHSERFQLAKLLEDAELGRDALAAWLAVDPTNERLRKMSQEFNADPAPFGK